MQRWVSVLAVLTVASAATIPSLPQVSWTIEDAIDLYNRGSNEDYIFKLVETDAEYVVVSQDQSTRPHWMHFTIMETQCLVSENKNTHDCDFKKGGAMKVCTAGLLVEPERNTVMINCDILAPKRTRTRRRVWPRCYRPGCFSIIGSFAPVELMPKLTPLIPSFGLPEKENKEILTITARTPPGFDMYDYMSWNDGVNK